MGLKKDGDRIKIAITLKKTNLEKLRTLADKGYRPMSQMLDMIIEEYEENRKRGGD